MDLLGDLGMEDQLTSARSENVILQQKVKDLTTRVQILAIENETLKAEVELYRSKEITLPSQSSLGTTTTTTTTTTGSSSSRRGGDVVDALSSSIDDPFVRSGNDIYPKKNDVVMNKLHGVSNVSTCALSPDDVILGTGGADGCVHLLPWGIVEGKHDDSKNNNNNMMMMMIAEKINSVECSAPVIALAFSPVLRGVLAVGCMDGSVGLIYYEQSSSSSATQKGPLLQTTFVALEKKHKKYVRNIAWSPNEAKFVSTSADGCIYMYKVDKHMDVVKDDNNEKDAVRLEASLIESLHLSGAIEACCYTENYIIVYVRGTPHLTYFNLKGTGENYLKQSKVNLNQQQGNASGGFLDHVSFAILDLKVHDGRYLAAATDASRNLVMELATGRILKNLYGHSNDGFSQPKVAWSQSGQYLLGNTQDEGAVVVWDIASEKIVNRLSGHGSPLRDMCSASTMDALVTTAFDKTTRLWFAE